jgi:hypothetical protein
MGEYVHGVECLADMAKNGDPGGKPAEGSGRSFCALFNSTICRISLIRLI